MYTSLHNKNYFFSKSESKNQVHFSQQKFAAKAMTWDIVLACQKLSSCCLGTQACLDEQISCICERKGREVRNIKRKRLGLDCRPLRPYITRVASGTVLFRLNGCFHWHLKEKIITLFTCPCSQIAKNLLTSSNTIYKTYFCFVFP